MVAIATEFLSRRYLARVFPCYRKVGRPFGPKSTVPITFGTPRRMRFAGSPHHYLGSSRDPRRHRSRALALMVKDLQAPMPPAPISWVLAVVVPGAFVQLPQKQLLGLGPSTRRQPWPQLQPILQQHMPMQQ